MKIKAYILAADPAWIEASTLAYYDLVDEIIVSYDRQGRGWTGVPIAVDACLARLRAIDRDGKLRFCPGDYARPGYAPMANETYQRQCALDAASAGADWVLQLDSDEVLAAPRVFYDCLDEAQRRGDQGLDYPARYFYRQLGNNRYLEICSRFWGVTAGFPGPVAVRAGTTLTHARQCAVSLFRVDFLPRNTDPWHPKDAPVHRTVGLDQGIYHFSWVRDGQQLQEKTRSWGHAADRDWQHELDYWAWCGRHPLLAMLHTPFARRIPARRLRIAALPELHLTHRPF